MRRQGARVRIDVQLIDARTGFPVWSRGYDRDRFQDDILQVEADIAASVSTALQVKLLGADAAQLALGGSHNPRAFDAYLRGMADSQGWDNAPVRQAIQDFSDAISLDPGFAAAYVGRASMLRVLASTAGVSDVAAANRMAASARSDVDHAISLEPLLPDAHRVRAEILFYMLDFSGASAEMTRALDLAPGNSRIESSYGLFETKLGHIEPGVAALRRAVALDPLQPAAYRALAAGLFYARHYDEALEALHRYTAIDQHPNRSTQYMESTIDLAKGDPASAVRLCHGDDAYANICLAIAYHALGRTAEAAEQLARLQKSQGDNAAFNYAYIYAQWGQPAEALRWLRTAVKVADSSLSGLKTNPLLDPIRGLPEFQQIQRQLNFPP